MNHTCPQCGEGFPTHAALWRHQQASPACWQGTYAGADPAVPGADKTVVRTLRRGEDGVFREEE